jgi:hypothetical protein
MNTQNIIPDSISAALVANPDRPSGVCLTLARAPDPRVPLVPPAERPELLRASQVASVAPDEIDWLYENTDGETDPVCVHARSTIEAWFRELSPEHQFAIALHHDPLPWPEELAGHEEDSFALVLHLLWPSMARDVRCSTPDQLARRAHRAAEQIANEQLCAAVFERGPRALRHLTRRAEWDFATALQAYAKTRGRAPSVLAGLVRASSASEES